MKRFLCWTGCHSMFIGYYDASADWGASINRLGECKWCGFIGLIDSQGNLFGKVFLK